MRYQLDNEGYLIEVNFGCTTGMCTEYTGTVPEGYETIEEWYEDNCECVRSWKIVDGNLVYDASKDYKLQVLYEQEAYNNAHVSKKEMGMTSTEEINPYTDLFPSIQSSGGYIVGVDEVFGRVGNLPTEEVNLSLMKEQNLDLIELEFIGNNFLPNTATSTTNNGITYTQNKDKTIKISGTATDRSTLNLAGTDTSVRNILTFKANENYLLFGLTDGVSLEFYNYDGTDRTLIGAYNKGLINYDVDVNITQVVLVVESGTIIDTTIKPMISLSPIEYPILPMTKYKGNLFDGSKINVYFNSSNQFVTYNNALTTNNISATSGDIFTLSSSSYSDGLVIASFDSSGSIIERSAIRGTILTYTCPANTSYIIASNVIGVNANTMLVRGPEVAEYKEYNGRDGQYYVDGISSQNTRSGKNLFDGEIELGSINPANGTLTSNNSRTRSKNYIKVKPNTTYTITRSGGGIRWIIGYSSDKAGITDGNFEGYPSALASFTVSLTFTFTTSSTTEYIKWYDTSSTDLTEKIQIEEGSTATEYEPYGVSPSPDYPSEIVNTYKAGTYNVVIDNKVFEFTIPEDLRGLPNGIGDRLWFDADGNNGIDIEKKVGIQVISDGRFYDDANWNGYYVKLIGKINEANDRLLCDRAIVNRIHTDGTMYENQENVMFVGNNTDTIETLKAKYDGAIVYYELATYTTTSISEYSYNEYTYEEFKNNSTLIDLKGNTFTCNDKITIKDNQILLIKNGAIDKILDEEGNEIPVPREEIYLGDTVMPRTYTPYTHAYCHQRVYIDFKYKDPRNVDITKINLEGLILITNIETEYNFTSDDYTKVRNYIMGTEDLTDEEIELYDINGDGIVSSADYIIIKNMVDGVIPNKITGTLEINSTQSKRTIVLRDSEGKIKTSLGLNGSTTPYFSCEKLTLGGIEQPQILSGTSLPDEVVNGQVFLLYDE